MSHSGIGFKRSLLAALGLLLFAVSGLAQSEPASLQGQVTDSSGAAIPALTVVAVDATGSSHEAQTNEEGRYAFRHLSPGTYSIRIELKGFANFEKSGVVVASGQTQTVNASLVVALEKQQVTVKENSVNVSVQSENNASALVLKGSDLDALSDDPDELASQLQALAGPAAGPNGGEIYIDGFSGGQLPTKSSIREIRVNQNPFSAQYDKLGYGRIEILTKPGTDKWHGQGMGMFNDSALNSRNPFVSTEPGYHREFMDGSVGGPLSKKASIFIDGGRRDMAGNSAVSAVVLDSNLQQTAFSQAVPNPNTNTNLSSRVDYQLTANNTLTARYQFFDTNSKNNGIGQFALATQGYNTEQTEHNIEISDSQVLSARAVNDLRFEFAHDTDNQLSLNSDATLQVQGAFTGGGNTLGKALDTQNHVEIQNLTSITSGKHYISFGGRVRDVNEKNSSTGNFNGTFTFGSLPAYQSAEDILLACQQAGETICQASGASQFTLTAGNPAATVNWVDLGLYAEDQWRLRSNMSLNFGIRYETQNTIHDHTDFAPRVGLAWALGHGNSAKTVIRTGFGIFYDRFQETQIIEATHLNGENQTQYVVTNPDFFPTIPSISDLAAMSASTTAKAAYQIDPHLRAPYTIQSAVGAERQVTKSATFSVTYLNSHGVRQLMTRNINAPLPGTYVSCLSSDTTCMPSAGIRPYPDEGNLYQFESDGLFNQDQLITNINLHLGTRFSLFGFYSLNFADSDTSGVTSSPSNSYDIKLDYGRAAFDIRHRVFLGGSFSLPKGVRLSPFMIANSGSPFNITTGQDNNGDSIFNDRPTYAAAGASGTDIVKTRWGTFDTDPQAGGTVIPINLGTGPGQFSMNLRLTKTIGLGRKTETRTLSGPMGPPPGGGRGGPPGGGGGLGGGLGPGGLSSGGGRGGPPGQNVSYRYNLTVGIGAMNAFNIVNLGAPVGQLSSKTLFGKSNSLASGFGPPGGGNRLIDFQVMFSF
ncbi:MAG: carboxypeptidase regulatory-like domain-containing protein [Terriglobia bacterium]